jgi:hypothetical protein
MTLNETQKAFLDDPDRLQSLAEWALQCTSNHIAAKVRQEAGFERPAAPAPRPTARLAGYLSSNSIAIGDLARLINAFLQATQSA